ncbi:hypothetical protein C8R43DRAFT_1126406 [Mycena crocata]|nr:hypothetical protein C8R43DRAFT_1126406 [Mycena crocata]
MRVSPQHSPRRRHATASAPGPPPANFANWFRFAQEKHCLIDEYDQIHRDFKPFYQLAEDDATAFQTMIERARRELAGSDVEIAYVEVLNGEVLMEGGTEYEISWPLTLRHISNYLHNITFLMNGRDEPRVAFNVRASGARDQALLVNDPTPFLIQPRPTSDFFARQSGCDIPMEAGGFTPTANAHSGFLIASAKPGFTTDLYPILSMAKVSPCFSDIFFPTEEVWRPPRALIVVLPTVINCWR